MARTELQRQDSQVAGYSRALRAVFEDWLRQAQVSGMSTRSLGGRLQEAAQANYRPAFLRGKRQAYPAAQLTADDQAWIGKELARNRTYVEGSLESDLQDKAVYQQMTRADLGELGRMFGSRVERQYGGQLWRVTEAGFLSGARDLSAALKARFRLPLRLEEAGDGEDDDQVAEEAALVALALALGISVLRLRRALDRAAAGVFDVADATTQQAIDVAADLGIDAVTLAGAAASAIAASAGAGSSDTALATALGLTMTELLDLGGRLQRGERLRVGTAYRTQADGDVCGPCIDAGAGGDGNGNYYEPDEPPLPGEDCRGRGNCRCWLETVWTTDEAA